MAAALFMLGFLLIMFIVPWIMARESAEAHPTQAGRGLVGAGLPFSSDREKRLWLWTFAVLMVIYSTLGLAPEILTALRQYNWLQMSATALLLLSVVTMVVLWAKTRPGRRQIGVAIGVTAVYFLALSRASVGERTHLFEYGMVAILIYHALLERRRNGHRIPAPAVLAVVATALLGWLDEGIQSLLPNRVYDIQDVAVNAIAGLAAIIASAFMAWARRWDAARRQSV